MADNSEKVETKNQEPQLFGSDIGEKRKRKPPSRYLDQGISSSSTNNRSNSKKAKEQAATPDLNAEEKVALPEEKKVASNIKKFLERGYLNGMVVTCSQLINKAERKDPSDVKTETKTGTRGVINDSQILCLCQNCSEKLECAYSTTEFESHAGCKKRHPAENFYLNNGKTVRDVMNACKKLQFTLWDDNVRKLVYSVSDVAIGEKQGATAARNSDFGLPEDIMCEQCENKLLKEEERFCNAECEYINSKLQELVQAGEERFPNNPDMTWRLIRGNHCNEETKKLLPHIVHLFKGIFDDMDDNYGHDLVRAMVYGESTKSGLDFHGTHCAILLVESNVVCAGIIRIFGVDMAELLLFAVKKKDQGEGYCRALFSRIKDLLESLKVKKLVLSATTDAKLMWIEKFKFLEATKDECDHYDDDGRMMKFEESTILHKEIGQQP